ncbi:MAG TPA: hypothetical protein VKS60_10240, partial [Stellaceae bacterium]|nr:hypothetical protein [Stellaceae bacterium]
MKFSVCHSVPGRIRLRVPDFGRKSALADSALTWLGAEDWVNSARINYECASLVVEYDRTRLDRFQDMLERLQALTLDGPGVLLLRTTPAAPVPAAGTRAGYAPPPQDWPLALPSVSLALAFWAHPISLAVNVPLMLYCGLPIFRRAWNVWSREKRLNVDFLDTLAIGASLIQGNMVTGGVITWLIRLGDWIRDLTAAGSKRAASELLEFQGRTAWILRDGAITSVPAATLETDDLVVVYPGEMIPV